MAQGEIRIPPEAIAALRQGRTIEAIKHLRDATGLDLKRAKAVIDAHAARIDRGQAQQTAERMSASSGVAFPQDAAEALARGDLIDAIKRLREANPQFDLKTAKDLVEKHRHGAHASAPMASAQKRVPTVVEGDRGSRGWLWLVALAAIFALWYLFSGRT
ncbi:MAG TPA: ribosomal protein L7/L12 [Luteimonas sp.]|nr:ribosomal protein L7/L12 [Luteimonas sp.]